MTKLLVIRETLKAVMVENEGKSIWLPKGQIKIVANEVVSAEKWILREKELESVLPAFINFTVEKVNDEKCIVSNSIGKNYKRKLYKRIQGKYAGKYLLNYKSDIYSYDSVLNYIELADSSEEDLIQEVVSDDAEIIIEVMEEIKDYKSDGIIRHEKYYMIKTCVENDIPVYLVGPAGSGKNHTLEQIAEDLHLDFYFTNSIQQEYKLTGFIDAGGLYHDTEFYRAFVDGGLFFLDEMDASIPEVLVLLNAAIANKYFEFPTGKVTAHDNFRVVSAGNTMGNGADEQYTGRLVLDQATLDRFAIVEFDYSLVIETHLAKGNMDLVNFVRQLRTEAQRKGIRATFSYRCITMVTKLELIMKLEDIMMIAVMKGFDKDTIGTFNPAGYSKYHRALESIKRVA